MSLVTPRSLPKSRTGIDGLDSMTGGGLPTARVTLVEGGPGAGKTLLALQSLVNGARQFHEPGIFVAFEESAARIKANAATFGWDLDSLQRKKLFFLDAKPTPDLVQAGAFDLGGMLAAIDAKARQIRAKRIVFDALDVVLTLLNDPEAERREIYRLHEWLLDRGLTAIITAKAVVGGAPAPGSQLQFMVDCAIALSHYEVEGVSQRGLRILKYRGSEFAENRAPLVIASHGVEVAGLRPLVAHHTAVPTDRVSTGVGRLDTMLAGGYYRGASILITGAPGTAKTTLCGAFVEAACQRGERALLVSFDSDTGEIVRNLASVGINLERHRRRGLLRLASARAGASSAEVHFSQIKRLALAHRARCVVVDPLSALSKQGNQLTAHGVVERLTDWAKAHDITLLCSSLLDGPLPDAERSPLQISTIADTWIHLSYLVHGGERNRALTIVKSRGTAHSNQVRELVLATTGVSLTDVYTEGGAVLMGALRWEREQEAVAERARRTVESHRRLAELDQRTARLSARKDALEQALEATRGERASLGEAAAALDTVRRSSKASLRNLRRADATPTGKKKARS